MKLRLGLALILMLASGKAWGDGGSSSPSKLEWLQTFGTKYIGGLRAAATTGPAHHKFTAVTSVIGTAALLYHVGYKGLRWMFGSKKHHSHSSKK